MTVTVIPFVIGVIRTNPRGLVKKMEDLEIRRDHADYSIIKIGQNTEKSPGDLRRLTVSQTPVKTHRLTLV